jgi:hypothetical protein
MRLIIKLSYLRCYQDSDNSNSNNLKLQNILNLLRIFFQVLNGDFRYETMRLVVNSRNSGIHARKFFPQEGSRVRM